MLIQTARRRASGGSPPLAMHTQPPPPHPPARRHPAHPTLGTRRPRRPRAGMARPPPAGEAKPPPRRGLKRAKAASRRANEATRHLLYLFPLPSSRLGTVTRAHSPLVGSQSRGSVTLCRKLAPIPGRTLLPGSRALPPHLRLPLPPLRSPTHPVPWAPLASPKTAPGSPGPPPLLTRLVNRGATPGAANRRRAPAEPARPPLLHTYPLRMTWARPRTTTSCSGSLKRLFPRRG